MSETVLRAQAVAGLGPEATSGWAPGRVTLVGDHVDYVGGLVLACAVDRGVAVALDRAPDGRWRVVSDDLSVTRESLQRLRRQDIGDRPLAAVSSLIESGAGDATPLEIRIAANLPPAVGLSSSAAVAVATLVAMARYHSAHLPAASLAELAYHSEHDLLGIACGRLDQLTVVHSVAGHALLLDCTAVSAIPIRWPWPSEALALMLCDTGEAHDVAGAEYRRRRADAEAVLRHLGVVSAQASVTEVALQRLPERLRRRARHIFSETLRSRGAASALERGDAVALGQLMTASHRSLRDDCEVSTPRLDAVVAAAIAEPGCLGARMVGAGFGGSVLALVEAERAQVCGAAMLAATTHGQLLVVHPGGGAGAAAGDVVGTAPPGGAVPA